MFTYTCSTPIRASLLAAGFYVARGRSTGDKNETTIALTPEAHRTVAHSHELLPADWLLKWNRSGAKFPYELQAEEYPAFERLITGHAQFQS